MCGIAGAFAAAGADRAQVEGQLRTLMHRGPDAWGVFADGPAAVGQTRLSVIDLVTGDPPLTDESGRIGAVLNGEIYNFAELRDLLRGEGHTLTTSGDTEVLAHLAERRGAVEIARLLTGMFAFAIWDAAEQRLMLGRDRLGKKPLYYWWHSGQLVFGSEIKSLLAHPAVPSRLDTSVIPSYLAFGYAPTPRTFFEGVVSLPPGHVLTLSAGGTPQVERYWQPEVRPRDFGGPRPGMEEAAAEVRRLLREAVRRRLVADVPVGAFLSGGVDSSAVVALMVEESSTPVQTFCMGFDSLEHDERQHARLVARRLGTDHHEFVAKPHAVDLVEQLVWHHDQPFADSSAIPMWLLSKQTRQHVTVALSGDGGDELFAGYERFAAASAVGAWSRLPVGATGAVSRVAVGAAGLASERLKGRAERFVTSAGQGLPSAYLDWLRPVGAIDSVALLGGRHELGQEPYEALWRESAGAHDLDRLLLLNLQTYLLDDLLPKVDRTSMAHALEVRVPFLDHELVEYALTLPPGLKQRGPRLKRVLKHAVRGLVPDEVLRRPKRGFGVPLDHWFRGDLSGYLQASLGPGARVREHLDGSAVDRLLAEQASGAAAHGHALWTLLTLEVFLRRHGW